MGNSCWYKYDTPIRKPSKAVAKCCFTGFVKILEVWPKKGLATKVIEQWIDLHSRDDIKSHRKMFGRPRKMFSSPRKNVW